MFYRLVKQIAEREGVIEQLKATDQMLWMQRMNNIRNRATEIVNSKIIYTVLAKRRQGAISAAVFIKT